MFNSLSSPIARRAPGRRCSVGREGLRRGRPRWLASGAGLAAACAIAGCGGALPPPNLPNIANIERAIEGTLANRHGLSGTALCPQTVPEIAGEVFSCIVTIPGRRPWTFTVTEVNATGYVTYAGRP